MGFNSVGGGLNYLNYHVPYGKALYIYIFIASVSTTYEDGTERSVTSAHKPQHPGNHPTEIIQHLILNYITLLN
jgi:hypothetical protein